MKHTLFCHPWGWTCLLLWCPWGRRHVSDGHSRPTDTRVHGIPTGIRNTTICHFYGPFSRALFFLLFFFIYHKDAQILMSPRLSIFLLFLFLNKSNGQRVYKYTFISFILFLCNHVFILDFIAIFYNLLNNFGHPESRIIFYMFCMVDFCGLPNSQWFQFITMRQSK